MKVSIISVVVIVLICGVNKAKKSLGSTCKLFNFAQLFGGGGWNLFLAIWRINEMLRNNRSYFDNIYCYGVLHILLQKI